MSMLTRITETKITMVSKLEKKSCDGVKHQQRGRPESQAGQTNRELFAHGPRYKDEQRDHAGGNLDARADGDAADTGLNVRGETHGGEQQRGTDPMVSSILPLTAIQTLVTCSATMIDQAVSSRVRKGRTCDSYAHQRFRLEEGG